MDFGPNDTAEGIDVFLQQVDVLLQRLFHLLAGDSDISLGYGNGAMLEQFLHQDDIIVVIPVDLRSEKLPEGMGPYVLIAQIISDLLQMLLYCPFRDREYDIVPANTVFQAVDLHKLIDHEGYREGPLLLRLLFGNVQPIPGSVFDDIAQAQSEDVLYPQSQVRLKNQARCDPVIRTESGAAFAHCSYDFSVLFLCQGNCRFICH